MLAEVVMDRRSSGGERAQGLRLALESLELWSQFVDGCKRQQFVQICLRCVEWTSGRHAAKRKSSDTTLFHVAPLKMPGTEIFGKMHQSGGAE
jgi:hypothetical protein